MKLETRNMKMMMLGAVAACIVTQASSMASPQSHPKLVEAMGHCQIAAQTLQNAVADYGKSDPLGGHRVKALGYVNQAIAELQAGIKM